MTMTMAGGVGGGPGTWNIYIYIYVRSIPLPFALFVLFNRSRPKVQLGAFLGGFGLKKWYGTPLLYLGF